MRIQGMHCTSCKALIEDVCGELPGVTSCDVDVTAGTATLEHEESFDIEGAAKEIETLGDYRVDTETGRTAV